MLNFLIFRQQVTQVFYLVYANVPKLLIEKGNSNYNQRIPISQDNENALKACGLVSCHSQVFPPIVFNVSICGTFIAKNFDRIRQNLKLSWQSDAINGGLGNNNNITIVIINQTELIPDNL